MVRKKRRQYRRRIKGVIGVEHIGRYGKFTGSGLGRASGTAFAASMMMERFKTEYGVF